MGIGLFFPGLLAIWLVLKKETYLAAWRMSRITALLLILAALILSYINVPLAAVYLNLGGVFVFAFSVFCLSLLNTRQKTQSIITALVIAALIFACKSGLLWSLVQLNHSGLTLAIALSILLCCLSGSFPAVLCAAGMGVEIAGFIWTFSRLGEMGLSFLDIFCLIVMTAWFMLLIVGYLRRKLQSKTE